MPKLHTGNFTTRQELVSEVLKLYNDDLKQVQQRRARGDFNYKGYSIAQIGKFCGVSEAVAQNIVKHRR